MHSDPLSNRLRKNQLRLTAKAARDAVSCFRVYDRDMPEFPIAVDLFEGTAAVMHVYEPRHGISDQDVAAMAELVADALRLSDARVFVKRRRSAVGGTGYASEVTTAAAKELVFESGLTFLVNFVDYVDVGLFLDHRNLRRRVRDEARGHDVLNLFAYTGSFSVYAAAGGARSTTTVDLSPRTLQWAQSNMSQNGFRDAAHRFIAADAMEFLRADPQRYDLVVVDPPTISKSKRAASDFDVQRDHAALLARAFERLRPGGVVYFSTNFASFQIDRTLTAQELSSATVPWDFPRRPLVHRSFRLQR